MKYYKLTFISAPLSMRFYAAKDYYKPSNVLLIADAYIGYLEYNLDTSELIRFPMNQTFKFANNILYSKKHDMMYLSDSSSRFELHHFILDFAQSKGLGSLYQYNPRTNTLVKLMDQLHFANGVELSHDGDSLLVAETSNYRIMQYDIASKNASVFLEHMPCIPDNIKRTTHDQSYLIGCGGTLTKFLSFLNDWPILRRWIFKLLGKWSIPLFGTLRPKIGLVMQVSQQHGNNKYKLLTDSKARFHSVSEAFPHPTENYIYIGTFHNKFVARIKKE